MKPYCKLKIPYGIIDDLDTEYISVPRTSDGIKMAEWWTSATPDARARVAKQGSVSGGDYVGAWKDETSKAQPQDELVTIIKRMETENSAEKES